MIGENESRWVIDIDWLEANNHSFTSMASGGLCEKCRSKLKPDRHEVGKHDLLKALSTCCSKEKDFVTPNLPLTESTFRVLLANGNKPMTLDELGQQVNERRGINAYLVTNSVLVRLLESDQQYGFRQLLSM